MKVCLLSWNPSDSLSFASHCLSPLLLAYLVMEACGKRGATGNFLHGWCCQMVLNSLFGVSETKQLQPLNKTRVFHVTLIIPWADEPLCYGTYWSLSCKGSLWHESPRGIFTSRAWGHPCVLVVPGWIWLFPAHLLGDGKHQSGSGRGANPPFSLCIWSVVTILTVVHISSE